MNWFKRRFAESLIKGAESKKKIELDRECGELLSGISGTVLKFVQCGNYDDSTSSSQVEPQESACEAERTSFNADTTADLIAQSIVVI